MSTDKIVPSSKDPKISSADDLTKTTNKGDVELSEEELKRVTGGTVAGTFDSRVNIKMSTN
jgi:bacteriocin-like protein